MATGKCGELFVALSRGGLGTDIALKKLYGSRAGRDKCSRIRASTQFSSGHCVGL